MIISNVSGHFLIATPGLNDPNFARSVVLVCEHTKDGAFGLIVNRVLMDSFRPLLADFRIEKSIIDSCVFFGGPVKPDQGYIIYSPFNDKYESIKISGNLALSVSNDLLRDITAGKGPNKYLFALGFAGWSANQLEEELMTDSWLIAPLSTHIIFDMPVTERWRAAAGLIGVDLSRYSGCSGTA